MVKLAKSGFSLGIVGLVLAVTAAPAGEAKRIPLEVFASRADVAAYPIEVGMPFPAGALKDPAKLRLLGPEGAEISCQVEPLSRYTDGSLRAAMLVFLSPVSKERSSTCTVEFGEGVSRKAAPGKPVAVSEKDGTISVDTGALRFQVGKGKTLFSGVNAGGKPVLSEGVVPFIQEAGQTVVVPGEQAEVTVEEKGPMRAVVLVKGRFGSAPDAHSYQTRIHAYAGTGLVRVQHTVVGLDGKKPFELAGWGLRLPVGAKKAVCGVDGAAKDLDPVKGARLIQDGKIEFQWGTLDEEGYRKKNNPKREELPAWRYRMLCTLDTTAPVEGRADGWFQADVAPGSIAVCVRDFWQQYPNEFVADAGGMTLWLHSPRGSPFVGRPGTAKTHEVLLAFSESARDAAAARSLNAVFQDWPLARVSPEWVCATGVFGPLLPRSDPFAAPWNALADVMLGFVEQSADRICQGATWYVYGNSDFGDVAHQIHNFNVPSGHTAGFTREFLRGGDREWARLGARAARHWADVDVCHVDIEPKGPKDVKAGRGQLWMALLTWRNGFFCDRAPWLAVYEVPQVETR